LNAAALNVFIVHAHHEPRSFNGALTAHAQSVLAAAGCGVRVSDLYVMGFDPVSDRRNFVTVADPDYLKQQTEESHATRHHGFAPEIDAKLEKLDWCDTLVFQFPLWWFGLPAILKGWVDRVFAMGRTYGGGHWYDNGCFRGKRAMLSLTIGGPATMYREDGLSGDIHMLLYPIQHGILRFTGFDVLPPFIVHGPARIGREAREARIRAYGERLLAIPDAAPIDFPSLNEYDPETWRRITAG